MTNRQPPSKRARSAFVLGTYARTPFHPRSGKGAQLIDADGSEYWDLLGGIAVNVLGHKHPRLVKTLRMKPTRCCTSRISSTTRRRDSSPSGSCARRGTVPRVLLQQRHGGERSGAEVRAARQSRHERHRGARGELSRPDARLALDDRTRGVPHAVRAARAGRQLRRAERHRGARSGGRREDLRDLPRAGDGRGRHHPADRRIPRRGAADRRSQRRACSSSTRSSAASAAPERSSRSSRAASFPTSSRSPSRSAADCRSAPCITGDAIEGVVKPGHHGTTFGGNPVACRLGLAVLDEIKASALLPRINTYGDVVRAAAAAR